MGRSVWESKPRLFSSVWDKAFCNRAHYLQHKCSPSRRPRVTLSLPAQGFVRRFLKGAPTLLGSNSVPIVNGIT